MAYRKDQIGPGFVYVLRPTNPANRNEIKVGLSNDPEYRRKYLSGTASALPFAYERVWAVSNMALAEDIAHRVLAPHSMNASREHFYIVPMAMLEPLFGSVWYEPSDDELDTCLYSLLEEIERLFTWSTLQFYEVDCSQLPEYSRGRLAWKKGKKGASPPEPLF
jgi:hypothetical protein